MENGEPFRVLGIYIEGMPDREADVKATIRACYQFIKGVGNKFEENAGIGTDGDIAAWRMAKAAKAAGLWDGEVEELIGY